MSAQYFAKIDDNNVVIDIRVVTAEFMAANPERYSGVWVETFYDTPNKNYAGINWIYDAATQNFFYPPDPDES